MIRHAASMLGFWEMPLDNWQRMMSSMSPMMPGDLLRNMPHTQVKENFDRMLSAPGLGYTREEQAQYQDLIRRAWTISAPSGVHGFFNQLGVKSVERMRSLVQSRARAASPSIPPAPSTTAGCSCCEAVYAEEVSTPEYARIHGQLVNAQMALKKRMSVMVDESLGAMNMPTRSELRTMQDRCRRRAARTSILRHELDALKRRIANLPGGDASSVAPRRSRARKKTAPRHPDR
jgi:class III poly(R)-hydroxyalkanoic acid synthase PhaE subunit